MFEVPSKASVFTAFGVLLLTSTTVINAGKDGIESSSCPKIMCTKPPEGLVCNQTVVKSPVLLKRIGKLKTCCPAWRCKEEDGSFSTYFGMSGSEVPGHNDSATTELPGNSTHPDNSTAKPDTIKESKDGPIKIAEDKCAEARTLCPTPDDPGSCSVSTSKEALSFKPKGELDSCCPTYNCTKDDGTFNLHYLMTGGKMPKEPEAIEKEKGKSEGGKKCSKITCAPEPPISEDGPKCGATKDSDSSRVKALGTLRECCEVWKCAYDDGAYYTHFELQSPNFWIAETSFQSEPLVSGDDVAQATEASGSQTTVPSTSADKAKPASKHSKNPKSKSPNPKANPHKGQQRAMPQPVSQKETTTEISEETTVSSATTSEVPATEAEATEPTTPPSVPHKGDKPKQNPKAKKGSKTTTTKVSKITANGAIVGQTKTTSSSSANSYSTNTNSNSNWSGQTVGTGETVENTVTDGDPPQQQAQVPGPQVGGGGGGQMSPSQQQVMMMQQQQMQQQQMQQMQMQQMQMQMVPMGPPMGVPMGPPMMGPPMMGPPMFG